MRCAACTVSGKKYFTALCLVFPSSRLLPLRFPPQPFKFVHFSRVSQLPASLRVGLPPPPLPADHPIYGCDLYVLCLLSSPDYFPLGPACPARCHLSPALHPLVWPHLRLSLPHAQEVEKPAGMVSSPRRAWASHPRHTPGAPTDSQNDARHGLRALGVAAGAMMLTFHPH